MGVIPIQTITLGYRKADQTGQFIKSPIWAFMLNIYFGEPILHAIDQNQYQKKEHLQSRKPELWELSLLKIKEHIGTSKQEMLYL